MQSFIVGSIVALVLVVAAFFAYDNFQIDSSTGYHRAPQVHVDANEGTTV